MTTLSLAICLALFAGISIPLGALIASGEKLERFCLRFEIDSFISYFGGGALLAAIALVLIPYGMKHNSTVEAALFFLLGSLLLWQVDSILKKRGSSTSLFMGMLLDFIPESVLLGAVVTQHVQSGYLLAVLIALQNLPEGFASSREIKDTGLSTGKMWLIFLLAPAAGPLAAWLGHTLLVGNQTALGLLSMFCSGGILYLIFDDIAPKAHARYHDFPALGAVFGFLLGLVGAMTIH